MKRKIIQIDAAKCNGCGLCVQACHEGAIGLVDGKARLLREDYCDGLGDCLPACPMEAIRFEEREAPAYTPPQKDRGCPASHAAAISSTGEAGSGLAQWPVQMQLMSSHAACLEGADLLIAADCTAYACGDFHQRFMQGRVTLIGCPKLDDADYAGKLAALFARHELRSVTVARMEVPCCGGLVRAVMQAMEQSGKQIPLKIAVISIGGKVE